MEDSFTIDRLLGLADQFLEDWEQTALEAEDDTGYAEFQERHDEWQALRPLLLAAPEMLATLEKATETINALLASGEANISTLAGGELDALDVEICAAIRAARPPRDVTAALVEALEFCVERLEMNNLDASEAEAINTARLALMQAAQSTP
jgi:hypothetical protein